MKQAVQLKEFSKVQKLDKNKINEVISKKTSVSQKISFTSDNLKNYFPKEYTVEQMEDVVYKLLEDWAKVNK